MSIINNLDSKTREILASFDGIIGGGKDGTISYEEGQEIIQQLPNKSDLTPEQKTQITNIINYRRDSSGNIGYFGFRLTSGSDGFSALERRVTRDILQSPIAWTGVSASQAFSDGVLTLHEIVKSNSIMISLFNGGILTQSGSDYMLTASATYENSYAIHKETGSYTTIAPGSNLTVDNQEGKSTSISVPKGWKLTKVSERGSGIVQTSKGYVQLIGGKNGYYGTSPTNAEGKVEYKIWNKFGRVVDSGWFTLEAYASYPFGQEKVMSFDDDGTFRIETRAQYTVRVYGKAIEGSPYSTVTDSQNREIKSQHTDLSKHYGSTYTGSVKNVETVWNKNGDSFANFIKDDVGNRVVGEDGWRPSDSQLEENNIHPYTEVFVINGEPYFAYATTDSGNTQYYGSNHQAIVRDKTGKIVANVSIEDGFTVSRFQLGKNGIQMVLINQEENNTKTIDVLFNNDA